MNTQTKHEIAAKRVFTLLDAIENKTNKMTCDLDNERFTKVIDYLSNGKESIAVNIVTKWYDEVN